MHFGWATGSSSTSSHGLRGVRKSSQGTAKPKQKSSPAVELSKYEVDRLKRIEENRKHMASLGLTIAEMKLATGLTRQKNMRLDSARNAVRSLRQYHGRDGESPVVYAVAKQSQRWTPKTERQADGEEV